MASRKVFKIFELSELIIEQLEPFEILVTATRICQFWNAVVNESHALQRKLWMRPRTPSISPHSFQPFEPQDHREWTHGGEPHYRGPITLNPLFLFWPPNEIDCEKRFLRNSAGERVMCYIKDKVTESVVGKRTPANINPSWRRMYLTDPPITIAAVQSRMEICKMFNNERSVDCCVRDESGITLGLLKDMADKATERHMNGSRPPDDFENLWPSWAHFVISPEDLPDPPVARNYWRELRGSSVAHSGDVGVYTGTMNNPRLKIWVYRTREITE